MRDSATYKALAGALRIIGLYLIPVYALYGTAVIIQAIVWAMGGPCVVSGLICP